MSALDTPAPQPPGPAPFPVAGSAGRLRPNVVGAAVRDRAARSRPSPCPGSVIAHEDRSLTCTEVGCLEGFDRTGWIERHGVFVGCGTLPWNDPCPRCRGATPRPQATTGRRDRAG